MSSQLMEPLMEPRMEPRLPSVQRPFSLEIPLPKMLTAKEELALAREAYAKHPESADIIHRLAWFLVRLDHFDEAITLMESQKREEVRDLNLFSTALLSRETPEDDRRSQAIAERAVTLASTPRQRAMALTQLAKVHKRLGDLPLTKSLLKAALEVDPNEMDAYKRLFRQYLEVDSDGAAARKLAEDSIARGVLHARVLGSLPLALTHLGLFEEARHAEGFDEFLAEVHPGTPPGWNSLEEFHAALTEEALNHPDMRYDRYGTASERTWRLDEPTLHRTKIFPQLQQLVKREVETYVANLSSDHPFAGAVPARATLRNWCVITEGDGHETWHVHQNGWLSGVYYIHVQDHIANGTGNAGCIAFGLPEEVIGEAAAAAFGERVIRPHTGLMMMFPSHIFHRTYPHHGTGRRICFAFDIIPIRDQA